EAGRNAVGRSHFEHVGGSFGRFRGADPRDGPIRRQQPHERQPRELGLPHAPELILHALLIDLWSAVALPAGGILSLVLTAAAEAAAPEPASSTAASIAAATTAPETAAAAERASA